MNLPGQTKIIVWERPDTPRKLSLSHDEAIKWRGRVIPDDDVSVVELRKQCTLFPHTNITIKVVLEETESDSQQSHIDISMDGTASFTLLEASDFSIAMIEAIKTLKVAQAHRKGELYGPDSDGGIRYE